MVEQEVPHADISVIIPAYNRAHLITQALDSIAAQELRPAEVIVVDDGSTDSTAEIAAARGAMVLHTPVNSGSGPARNLGIEKASGSWIAFLDSDDVWSPQHLSTISPYLTDYAMVASAGTTTRGMVVGNPGPGELELTPRLVLETSELVVTSACVASREALIHAGLFRDLRRAQDLDLWLRVLAKGRGLAVPSRTITYVHHEDQASRDRDLMLTCFGEIVESCSEQPWFDRDRGTDRAYARVRWDDFRAATRDGRHADAWRGIRWFGSRPHAWPALLNLLRLRRRRRLASSSLPLTSAPSHSSTQGL